MFKSKKVKVLLALLLVFVMFAAVGCGGKQEAPKEEPKKEEVKKWPEKDITLIYHSKAGSGGDMFLRALAKALEPGFGKSVIVDNKPGAAGATAWKAALDAKDGHTFLGVSSTLITAPIMNKMDVEIGRAHV